MVDLLAQVQALSYFQSQLRASWERGIAWIARGTEYSQGWAALKSPESASMFGHGIAELPSDPGSSVFQLVLYGVEKNCSRSPSAFPGFRLRENLGLRNMKPTLGIANDTFSVCFERALDKLLFTGVELRIGFGGLELENLRVVTGALTTSSEEVDSLSSSSVLLRCVAKWIGCGATLGRVYEETD